MNRSTLTDPIDPADALLNSSWCPRQLEMDDESAALLQVEPFARCIGGEQYSRPT